MTSAKDSSMLLRYFISVINLNVTRMLIHVLATALENSFVLLYVKINIYAYISYIYVT